MTKGEYLAHLEAQDAARHQDLVGKLDALLQRIDENTTRLDLIAAKLKEVITDYD